MTEIIAAISLFCGEQNHEPVKDLECQQRLLSCYFQKQDENGQHDERNLRQCLEREIK